MTEKKYILKILSLLLCVIITASLITAFQPEENPTKINIYRINISTVNQIPIRDAQNIPWNTFYVNKRHISQRKRKILKWHKRDLIILRQRNYIRRTFHKNIWKCPPYILRRSPKLKIKNLYAQQRINLLH